MGKSIILRIFISLSDLISVDEAMVLILSSDFVVNESSGAHVKMIRAHVYFAKIYIYIYLAEMQKRKRPILCYSEFRAYLLHKYLIYLHIYLYIDAINRETLRQGKKMRILVAAL